MSGVGLQEYILMGCLGTSFFHKGPKTLPGSPAVPGPAPVPSLPICGIYAAPVRRRCPKTRAQRHSHPLSPMPSYPLCPYFKAATLGEKALVPTLGPALALPLTCGVTWEKVT